MPPDPTPNNPATTAVLYVRKKDAKSLKTRLEGASLLDKRFRMTPVDASAAGAGAAAWLCPPRSDDGPPESSRAWVREDVEAVHECIAVPVTAACMTRTASEVADDNEWKNRFYQWPDGAGRVGEKMLVGYGQYPCPYSTAMLGNKKHVASMSRDLAGMDLATEADIAGDPLPPLTHVQSALIEALISWLQDANKRREIHTLVRKLSNQTCPKKLEVIGDDGTLVIPRYALFDNADCRGETKRGASSEFRDLLDDVRRMHAPEAQAHVAPRDAVARGVQTTLWATLATAHAAPRVVRRGDVDPASGVRESGHRLLHPDPGRGDCNRGRVPGTTGPGAPGWITVTEHRVRQSFDLTRVMFSRGNVTEKRRFGALVRPGERVLDMYAGIGYYALPALLHGGARHVTACEWNAEALFALRYNLKANGVEARATVLEGDCRASLRRLLEEPAARARRFDRISLGLLPSSEGGWALAVACLDEGVGGWLHVHGNVPTPERRAWTHWLCRALADAAAAAGRPRWIAACAHVERVKSFAPRVDHVVADVFVGPCDSPRINCGMALRGSARTGIYDKDLPGQILPTPDDVSPPSCALREDGVLHQSWMREG